MSIESFIVIKYYIWYLFLWLPYIYLSLNTELSTITELSIPNAHAMDCITRKEEDACSNSHRAIDHPDIKYRASSAPECGSSFFISQNSNASPWIKKIHQV